MADPVFQIRVLVEPLDHPAALGAAHTGIVIYADDEPIMAFQGVAVDRENGQWQAVAIDPMENTLRAFVIPGDVFGGSDKIAGGITGNEDNYEIVVFEGSAEEVLVKMLNGMEAAAFMNDQNLPYVVADIVQSSQNSNSVMRTFLEAMDIEYSDEVESVFAPGDGRILIPLEWEARINLPENFNELTPDQQNEIMQEWIEVMQEVGPKLAPNAVAEQATTDPAPEKSDADSLYYDRAPIYAPADGGGGVAPGMGFER